MVLSILKTENFKTIQRVYLILFASIVEIIFILDWGLKLGFCSEYIIYSYFLIENSQIVFEENYIFIVLEDLTRKAWMQGCLLV